jgi:exosortase D (VPLPA-CTERM-specific)
MEPTLQSRSTIAYSQVFQILLATILVGSLFWLYRTTLYILFSFLIDNENFSYALLFPFISAYICYLKLPQIRQLPLRPSWLGLLIIALGFFINMLSDVFAVLFFSQLSFFVVLLGCVILIVGWKITRLLIFPIIILFFMVPPPALLVQQITLPLQLISSQLASVLLHGLGIPALRQGNVIDLGVRQLQVVDACSGLRYVFSLIFLGLIFCYFYQRRLWKAATLIIGVIPTAIIANGVRVTGMALYPALQEGFWHSFSGWLIFIFCMGALFFVNKLLNYLVPEGPPSEKDGDPELIEKNIRKAGVSLIPYLAAGLILVIVGGFSVSRFSLTAPVPLLQSFDNFPLHLGVWQGKRNFLDAAMQKAVGADDYYDAVYQNPEGGIISLWIAYFASQNRRLAGRIHSPLMCLRGGGWKFLKSKIIEVSPGRPVRYLLMKQGSSRQAVYFWYFQRGRWLASEYPARFYMALDSLTRHRNDGALVRIITPAYPDEEQARKRLDAFMQQLIPLLHQFIPQ